MYDHVTKNRYTLYITIKVQLNYLLQLLQSLFMCDPYTDKKK